jgi:hypothetical protein
MFMEELKMSVKKDYVPQNIDAFNKWFKHLHEYVTAKTEGANPVWHHIPADELEEFRTAFHMWQEVYDGLLGSDSVNAPSKRNFAKKRAELVIRPFVKRHLQYKGVPEEERKEMGLHIPDTIRSAKGKPQEKVDFSMQPKAARMIELSYRVLGAKGRGKPNGYDGAVFVWALLEKEPESLSELTNRTQVSRTPLTLIFSEEERGKKVYAAAAWQNGAEVLGPWSNIQFTYVP